MHRRSASQVLMKHTLIYSVKIQEVILNKVIIIDQSKGNHTYKDICLMAFNFSKISKQILFLMKSSN